MVKKLILKNNKLIEAVIFNVGGLMVEDQELWGRAFQKVIEQYIGEIVDEHPHITGMAEPDNWQYLMERYGFSEKIDVLIKKRKEVFYKMLNATEVKVMPGLYKAIKFFQKANLKIAICSSGAKSYIDAILAKLKLKKVFKTLVSSREMEYGSASSDMHLLCAKNLKVTSKYCLYLEDAPSGVKAAKRAGMQVVVVPNKYTKNCDFSDADFVLQSLKEIPTIFQ